MSDPSRRPGAPDPGRPERAWLLLAVIALATLAGLLAGRPERGATTPPLPIGIEDTLAPDGVGQAAPGASRCNRGAPCPS